MPPLLLVVSGTPQAENKVTLYSPEIVPFPSLLPVNSGASVPVTGQHETRVRLAGLFL